MFCGPHFMVSTMQAGTTPTFNVFGMTGPSSNRELNPQILLVSAGSPPIIAFYDQQVILRTYLLPGSSITPDQESLIEKAQFHRHRQNCLQEKMCSKDKPFTLTAVCHLEHSDATPFKEDILTRFLDDDVNKLCQTNQTLILNNTKREMGNKTSRMKS